MPIQTRSQRSKSTSSTPVVVVVVVVNIVPYLHGICPLQYNLIRKILEFIHDDLRYTLTRYGLDDSIEPMPVKERLSIHAILNARLMDYYKDVLLGQSLRERTWPAVKSHIRYKDIEPWLIANRCPYMYDIETKKTANIYGIYRYEVEEEDDISYVYEGNWRRGKFHGQGKLTYADGEVYEGAWKAGMRHGQGKCTYASGSVYEGDYKDDLRNGQGKYTFADGSVYEGVWIDDVYHG
jgi:hypothetical protein